MMVKSPEMDRARSKRRRERTYKSLGVKSESKTPLGRLTHNLEDNIKMDSSKTTNKYTRLMESVRYIFNPYIRFGK
jgi:hypothetical protein